MNSSMAIESEEQEAGSPASSPPNDAFSPSLLALASTKPLTSSSTCQEGLNIPASNCKEDQIGETIDQGKFRA